MFLATILAASCLSTVDDERSLESLLAAVRRERDAVHAVLGARVADLAGRLEAASELAPAERARVRGELDRLGPEAAPLLVPLLEPETADGPSFRLRAEEMTLALVRMGAPGVSRPLIAATEAGSEAARINAIRALGSVAERERAAVHLADLYKRTSGAVRLQCVVSLAALDAEAGDAVLRTALTDHDPDVVRAVLAALSRAGNATAAPAVLNLSRVPLAAGPVAAEIAGYWLAHPDLVDTEVLEALVALALRTDVAPASRVVLLDALPRFEEAHKRGFRRALEPLMQSPEGAVREAALVCAALIGDRSARRDLLVPYDEDVESSGWWKAYQLRADVLLRIEEYANAADDYAEALELLGERATERTHEDLWVDLARCHALSGKLAKARDALESVGMTPALRERLADDPDFQELIEHSSYGRILRAPD